MFSALTVPVRIDVDNGFSDMFWEKMWKTEWILSRGKWHSFHFEIINTHLERRVIIRKEGRNFQNVNNF